jgi:hypothetical protein
MKIILSTRSKHPDLTEKAQSLFDNCQCITNKQTLKNTTDWGYIYKCLYETDGDYLISIDEDFFLYHPILIDEIIKWMIDRNIEILGPKTWTVDAPVLCGWFWIANLNKIQKYKPSKSDLLKLRIFKTHEYYNQYNYSQHYYEYDKHEFFWLLMLEKGCKIKNLKIKEIDFEIIVVDYYGRDIEFGIHTRHGRDYNKKNHKKIIDETYNFVRNKYH